MRIVVPAAREAQASSMPEFFFDPGEYLDRLRQREEIYGRWSEQTPSSRPLSA
jgi:hypothetical protein